MKKSLRIVAGSLVLALGLTACQVKKTEPSGKAANEKLYKRQLMLLPKKRFWNFITVIIMLKKNGQLRKSCVTCMRNLLNNIKAKMLNSSQFLLVAI